MYMRSVGVVIGSNLFYLFNAALLALTKSPIYAGITQLITIVACFFFELLVWKIHFNVWTIIAVVIILIAGVLINILEVIPEKWDPSYIFFVRVEERLKLWKSTHRKKKVQNLMEIILSSSTLQ